MQAGPPSTGEPLPTLPPFDPGEQVSSDEEIDEIFMADESVTRVLMFLTPRGWPKTMEGKEAAYNLDRMLGYIKECVKNDAPSVFQVRVIVREHCDRKFACYLAYEAGMDECEASLDDATRYAMVRLGCYARAFERENRNVDPS